MANKALSYLLFGVKQIYSELYNTYLPKRKKLAFDGSYKLTDDEANDATIVAQDNDDVNVFYHLTGIVPIMESLNAVSVGSGNYTTGVVFYVNKTGRKCYGMRFYIKVPTTRNITLKLWRYSDSTVLRTAVLSVSPAQPLRTVTWAPYDLVRGIDYVISMYDPAGSYTRTDLNILYYKTPPPPNYSGLDIVIANASAYNDGDARPILRDNGEVYLADPIILEGTE